MNLQSKVRFAIKILEKFKDWNRKYVFFSGGKDSLVALDLAAKFWKDFEIIYVEVTGNTHPKCNKYARKIGNEYGNFVHLKNEEEDFFERLGDWGYPSIIWIHSNRWCLKHFKNRPIHSYVRYRGVGVSGISPCNSSRRKMLKLQPIMLNTSYWVPVSILPLYHFTEKDVWSYIRHNGLEINPLYGKIGASGNCVICPGMSKCKFIRVARHCKEFFHRWRKAHEKIKHSMVGIREIFRRFDEWYEFYCKNKSLDEFFG